MKSPTAFVGFAAFAVLCATWSAPALAAEAVAAAAPDVAKGEATAAVCMACHAADGTRGIAPTFPLLQGQHAAYIVKQLTEFKEKKRTDPTMDAMVLPLTEEDMRNVAAFFASKKPVNGAAKNIDTLALGEKIWRGGLPAKQIPACAGCHSPNGAGIPAQYPRLGGQHVEYIEKQMNAFRDGTRSNSAQMTGVAALMSEAEIKAVADFAMGLH